MTSISESPSCFEQALCLHSFYILLTCALSPLVLLLIPRSLMNSIVQEKGFLTRGTPEEVSTVGIDLLRHRLRGIKVEFYDCAGQLDYAGMHDIFLSRRALYLLVWDVKKCYGKHDNDLDKVRFRVEPGL